MTETFARWRGWLGELESAYAAPKPEPLVPGPGWDRPVSAAWREEMRRRADLLRPLAREMADVYRQRLDGAGRRRAQELLAAHPKVGWQFTSAISECFGEFLDTQDADVLERALALIAIYDRPALSKDFARMIYPIRARMVALGLDAGGLFDAALPLTTRHADPAAGAHGLFRTLGRQWDRTS